MRVRSIIPSHERRPALVKCGGPLSSLLPSWRLSYLTRILPVVMDVPEISDRLKTPTSFAKVVLTATQTSFTHLDFFLKHSTLRNLCVLFVLNMRCIQFYCISRRCVWEATTTKTNASEILIAFGCLKTLSNSAALRGDAFLNYGTCVCSLR